MVNSFVRQSYMQRVRFGPGTLNDLPQEVEALGVTQSLLIGGGSASGVVASAREALGRRVQSVFEDPQQHVPRSVADTATELAITSGADSLVCIGGGKAIGLAKAVALELRLPIVAVPTTLSGSEVTPVFGISEDGRKNTGRDPAVLPTVVIYDSQVFQQLPNHVAGPSGMNALAHAIGGLVNESRDPIVAMIAEPACRTIFNVLARLGQQDTQESVSGSDLALAGYLGGYSLAHANAWFHHKACHILGGLYGLPHAPTHAAMLPHSVSILKTYDSDAYGSLQNALQIRRPEEALFKLLTSVSGKYALAEHGMTVQMAETGAQKIVQELPMFEEVDARDRVSSAVQGTFLNADGTWL